MSKSDNDAILKMTDFISLDYLGDAYDSRMLNGNCFWKKDSVGYNEFIKELYKHVQGEKLKISLKGFENLVIADYFDLTVNDKQVHSLRQEIEEIPVERIHALLPLFNIQTTASKVNVGDYCLVQFQEIGKYINEMNWKIPEVHENDFKSDSYFLDVPFVDIVVEARDDDFALDMAKSKMQSFISFLNYCLFSDIKGVEVVSSHADTGIRSRHYLISPTSFCSSSSVNSPGIKRPDVSELLECINREEDGNRRLIEIVQKSSLENEIEKRVFNALNWIGLAIAEKNNAIALTQAIFAIECLLQTEIKGEPISKSIVASISESLAFLLGDSFEKRKDLEKQFKKIYGLRSKVAHGKGNDVTIDNVLDSIFVAKQTIIAILTTPELKNAKTIQMVSNYIEKKRYTCAEDER